MATQAASDLTNFRPAFRGNEDKPEAREGLGDGVQQAGRFSGAGLPAIRY